MNTIDVGLPCVAAIVVICYLIGLTVKNIKKIDDKWIPTICGISGGIIGLIALVITMPDFPATDGITAFAIGVLSGLSATGINQLIKQHKYGSDDISNETNDVFVPEGYGEEDEKGDL